MNRIIVQRVCGILWGGLLLILQTCTATAQEPVATATATGGWGLIHTQSALTTGAGSVTIGLRGTVLEKETPVISSGTDYVTTGAMPLTLGLTDDVDLSMVMSAYRNGRPFRDISNLAAGYRPLTDGFGASRFGIKIRLPFDRAAPVQIAGSVAAQFGTANHQLDGLNYRWTRTETDIEASLLQTVDLTSFWRLYFEQGYVLTGSQWYDDQIVGAAGMRLTWRNRAALSLEVMSRTFRGGGLQPLINAGNERSLFSDAAEVGNIAYLTDSDTDYFDDFLVFAPSVAIRVNDRITIDLGATVNLADHPDPAETVQGVFGITILGSIPRMIDSDRDGVNNHHDLEPGTPLGYPVNSRGISVDTDQDGVPDGSDREPDTIPGAEVNAFGIALDTDGDGVPDGRDREPDTAQGLMVDEYGVSIDSDRDGVPDGMDRQPQTPVGAIVDADGMAIDSDSDGVPDGLDREPDTLMGAVVNREGISLDGDGDGVPDGLDQEPDTPRGIAVDAAGRALIRQEYSLLNEGIIRLNSITFSSGTSWIDPDSYPVLDEIGTLLLKYPSLTIQIGGHTDSVGDQALNYRLSRDRAQAVRTYLLEQFPDITVERLHAVGYGADRPVSTNATPEGRAQNRRVEFIVLNQDQLPIDER